MAFGLEKPQASTADYIICRYHERLFDLEMSIWEYNDQVPTTPLCSMFMCSTVRVCGPKGGVTSVMTVIFIIMTRLTEENRIRPQASNLNERS